MTASVAGGPVLASEGKVHDHGGRPTGEWKTELVAG